MAAYALTAHVCIKLQKVSPYVGITAPAILVLQVWQYQVQHRINVAEKASITGL